MLSLPLEALNPVEIVADLEVTGWTLVELAAKGGLPGHLAEPLSHWPAASPIPLPFIVSAPGQLGILDLDCWCFASSQLHEWNWA